MCDPRARDQVGADLKIVIKVQPAGEGKPGDSIEITVTNAPGELRMGRGAT